jgi:limonene-1,2-epoxide hydrolase
MTVGVEQEQAVRAFIQEFECERLDSARLERLLDCMAPDARYHVFAWETAFVGRDAIHDELLRQAPLYSDAKFEFLNIASAGQTVFVERIDSVTMNGKRAGFHVVGVFDVDAYGKITSWRDYCDSREMAVAVGPEPGASLRAARSVPTTSARGQSGA